MHKKHRGFSLVEVVIAMSVTMIVSIGAISAMLTSGTIVEKSDLRYWAATEVNNLRECFISDGFSDATGNALQFYLGSGNIYRLTADGDNYKYSFFYDKDKNLLKNVNTGYMKIEIRVTSDLKSFNASAMRVNPDNSSEVQMLFEMTDDGGNFQFVKLRP